MSDLPERRLPDDHGHARLLPGASAADDGATVATPLEKAVLDDRRHRQHDVDVEPRSRRRSSCSSRSTATSTPPRRTCRPRSRRRCGTLPQGIIPPSYQKTNPADAPILTLALTSDVRCRSRRSTNTARRRSRSACRWSAASRRCWSYGTQKYAVRIQLDPAQLASRGIALEDVTTAVANQNVNIPTGVLWGRKTALTHPGHGTARQRGRVRGHDRRVPQRRAGAPARSRPASPTTCRTTRPRAGYNGEPAIVLAIQRQPGTNTVDGRQPRQGRAREAARRTSRRR